MQSKITAIGIANPPFKRTQVEVAKLIVDAFHLDESQERILKKFINHQESTLDIAS